MVIGHLARFIVTNLRMVANILIKKSKRVKSRKSDFFISLFRQELRAENSVHPTKSACRVSCDY